MKMIDSEFRRVNGAAHLLMAEDLDADSVIFFDHRTSVWYWTPGAEPIAPEQIRHALAKQIAALSCDELRRVAWRAAAWAANESKPEGSNNGALTAR